MDDCSHFSRQTSNHFGLFSNVQRFSILSNDLFCSHLLQNCTVILSYTLMYNFHIHSMNFVHCALEFHGSFKSFLFHSRSPEGALSVSFTSLSSQSLSCQSLSCQSLFPQSHKSHNIFTFNGGLQGMNCTQVDLNTHTMQMAQQIFEIRKYYETFAKIRVTQNIS